jgi:BirA family transcriptional regulator, biotin operon repressor / biotin---[acetyl-CoA-carboxylase] ligase
VIVPPIEAYDALDSTNAEARRRAEVGNLDPVWITATRQTAGRGRRGRAWETVTGNLAATLLISTEKAPGEAAQISFVAALAAADLAEACLGGGIGRLKWPNDLMIHGRKAAGILVESGTTTTNSLWLAVGLGVNLAHSPIDVERLATSFAEFMPGPPPSPLAALDILARRFCHWQTIWESQGFAPIATAWTERAYGLGEACEARLPNQTHRGIAEALDSDGALRLRLADGSILRITAGDVFFGET